MFSSADFFKSSSVIEECPQDNKPEFAFIGRSNVGKSSLINALVNRKELAKTSSKPGKTKLINHFIIDESWYLVDLPGYGYASVSKVERKAWALMTERYLKERETLVCLFVLVDSRIPPQKIDLEFFNKLGEWGVPFQIVFTKSDKVKKAQRMGVLKNMQTQLAETWSSMPDIHFTSSQTKFGLQQIEELILHYLSLVD
jgi:GTP-binding protein